MNPFLCKRCRQEHIGECADVADLIRQRDELQKDAERYRWLRESARTDTGEPWIARSFLSGISAWTGEHADAAIDAAIAKVKP